MSEFRTARIAAQDISDLEEIGYALFRHREDGLALKALAFALKLRSDTQFPPEWDGLPDSPILTIVPEAI